MMMMMDIIYLICARRPVVTRTFGVLEPSIAAHQNKLSRPDCRCSYLVLSYAVCTKLTPMCCMVAVSHYDYWPITALVMEVCPIVSQRRRETLFRLYPATALPRDCH